MRFHLKQFLSYFLVLILMISPIQPLMAKTNQGIAVQNNMNSMVMPSGMMHSDCEHCKKNGHLFLNCSVPNTSNFAITQLDQLAAVTQTISRLPFNNLTLRIYSFFPELFIIPPIS